MAHDKKHWKEVMAAIKEVNKGGGRDQGKLAPQLMGLKPKAKALKKKVESSSSIKSYQPDQMYSDAAMKRFSAKHKRLGHDK